MTRMVTHETATNAVGSWGSQTCHHPFSYVTEDGACFWLEEQAVQVFALLERGHAELQTYCMGGGASAQDLQFEMWGTKLGTNGTMQP